MRRILFVILAALAVAGPAKAWTWPASGPVLLPYSFDPDHPYGAGQHRGIDVGGGAGETILAPAGGVISFAGTVPGSGKSVTIITPDGWSVTLTQLGSIAVAKGAVVVEGGTIGTIGPSGDPEVSGAYVQLGVRHADDDQGYVDPQTLLPSRPASPSVPAVGDPGAPAPGASASTPASAAPVDGATASAAASAAAAPSTATATVVQGPAAQISAAPSPAAQGSAAPSPAAQAPAAQASAAQAPAAQASAAQGPAAQGPAAQSSSAPTPVAQGSAVHGSAALHGSVAAASASPVGRTAHAVTSAASNADRALTPRIAPTRYDRRRSQPATTEQRGAFDRGSVSDRTGSGARPLPPRTTTLRAPARASAAHRLADVRGGHPQAVEYKPASRGMPSVTPSQAGASRSSITVEPKARARASVPASAVQARARHAKVTRSAAPHSHHSHVVSRRVAVPKAAPDAIARLARVPVDGVVPRFRRGESPVAPAAVLRHKGRGIGSLRWLVALFPALVALALVLVRRRPGTPAPLRMMGADELVPEEDPGCARVAVRSGPSSPWPRGGIRGSVRRVRPISPVARQRRPHGERDGRARHARDGGRGPGREVLR